MKEAKELGRFFPSRPHEAANEIAVWAVTSLIGIVIAFLVGVPALQLAVLITAFVALPLTPSLGWRWRQRSRFKKLGLTRVRLGDESSEYPYAVFFTARLHGQKVKGRLVPSDAQAYYVWIDDLPS